MSDRSIVKVLILDDDEEDIKLVQSYLSRSIRHDYIVSGVSTTEDALLELKNPVDVLILDHKLGGTQPSGMDFLKSIRKKYPFLPVIFVTGFGDRRVQIEAFEAGTSDYLEKGTYNADMLERCISHAIKIKKMGIPDTNHLFQELVLLTRENVEAQNKTTLQIEQLKNEVKGVKEEVSKTSSQIELQIADLKKHATDQIRTIQEKTWFVIAQEVTNWLSQKPAFFLTVLALVLIVLVFGVFFINNLDALKFLQILQGLK